jgi:hypothetical protein
MALAMLWWTEHRQHKVETAKLRSDFLKMEVERNRLQITGDAVFKELRRQKMQELEREIKLSQ